ncbi:gamma-glutamyltransferase [Aliidiomarina minuta]|uniref:gamma-glutamyltransferase n=1 Tax=Aliidiomarina minuta TaxID=880057 RepID=UPI0013002154|nr:gamma-glutamyltransferase [Aliidiomarina minuta]
MLSVACSEGPELDDHSATNAIHAEEHVVVSANWYASDIGREILRQGGNAMDAAVATKIALTFSEPHETGLGGGGFLLYYDAESREQHFYDGRETAPLIATPNWFRFPGGIPINHWLAMITGRAVGTPGMIAMLHKAHEEHGRLPWATLFEQSIQLAEEGIPMPNRLRRQAAYDPSLMLFPDLRRYISLPANSEQPKLRNPQLAESFRQLANRGPAVFYEGDMGADYRARAARRWPWPSELSREDFVNYRAVKRDLVCGEYREWQICGAPPPSSGGIALLQILGVLEHYDIEAMQPDSTEFIHLLAESNRMAFADRQFHIGDPDFVRVNTQGLIDKDYLRQRYELLDPAKALVKANPGIPGVVAEFEGAPPVEEDEEAGTSHLAVVDSQGNAASMTGSIEAPFGSRMMSGGMIMNNQMTDFDFRPQRAGLPVANKVEGGKRPRSSMAPTFVFDQEGELQFILGSRGGSRIIGYVAKTLVGILDWELSLQEAIDLPNILHRGERLEIERGTFLEQHQSALTEMGHRVSLEGLESGLHGIERTPQGWRGAADGRMEGAALGD